MTMVWANFWLVTFSRPSTSWLVAESRWPVGQNDGRRGGQRTGDGHALLLSAGKLAG